MKEVLISTRPKWIEKEANGEKTIEVRKTRPKSGTPFKCYIYCTNTRRDFFFNIETVNGKKGEYAIPHTGNGKVIGEFVCDRIYEWTYNYNVGEYNIGEDSLCRTCLSYSEFENYGKGKTLYGWHISNLVIYDKPKELSEFYLQCEEYGKTGTIDTPKKCKKCRYQYTWNLASKCIIDGLKPITRPPQSWCYVEEGE